LPPIGIDRDVVQLIELTREASGTSEARKHLAGRALDHFDLRPALAIVS